MNSYIFWDKIPGSSLDVNRRFGGTYGLHLQGRIRRARYQYENKWQALRNIGGLLTGYKTLRPRR
jgi:hypothetical protein